MPRPSRRARREEETGDLSGLLISLSDPSDKASEAYRSLRTSLFYSIADTPPKVIVLTSHAPREGKSTVCANLGVVLAQANKKTLIVDCDLRKPTLHRIFGLRNIHGLTNVLTEEHDLQEVWQEPLENLKILSVGPTPPDPAEVLSSRRFAQFLDYVRQEFDYVLIDAPPTSQVSDPVILASQGDGVLLVLDVQSSKKGSILKSLHDVRSVGANVLGTVMNNDKGSKGGYHYGHMRKQN